MEKFLHMVCMASRGLAMAGFSMFLAQPPAQGLTRANITTAPTRMRFQILMWSPSS